MSLSSVEERELDGNHLVVTCKVSNSSNTIMSHALIDCGATGYAFIDKDFVATNKFPLYPLKQPHAIEVIDGRPISSGEVTHMTKVELVINGHVETLPAFITSLGCYPLVLEQPWLRKHDVSIRFATDTLTFDSQYCLTHCTEKAVQAKGISIEIPDRHKIAMISAASFRRVAKRKEGFSFRLSIYDIDQALTRKVQDDEAKIKEFVPEIYHDFAPLFSAVSADKLPPHRPYDHKIPLKEGFQPPFGPLCSLSRPELEVLR